MYLGSAHSLCVVHPVLLRHLQEEREAALNEQETRQRMHNAEIRSLQRRFHLLVAKARQGLQACSHKRHMHDGNSSAAPRVARGKRAACCLAPCLKYVFAPRCMPL